VIRSSSALHSRRFGITGVHSENGILGSLRYPSRRISGSDGVKSILLSKGETTRLAYLLARHGGLHAGKSRIDDGREAIDSGVELGCVTACDCADPGPGDSAQVGRRNDVTRANIDKVLSKMNPYSGNYPIESRVGEIERLRVQSAAMALDTATMLSLIGVRQGWSCVDLGCGPGGITRPLSQLVGPSGRVVGLDMNANFLEHARVDAPGNVEFRHGDAYKTDLPSESFDLVHIRFVASTAGAPERLLQEAIRLARPGGTIALQEPDGTSLNCFPPHPAWERLKTALLGAFSGVGADLLLARRLYALARQAGLDDVQYRPFVTGVRSMDPLVDYLPSTVQSLRTTVTELGLLSEAEFPKVLAECREHLHQADTVFTMYTVAQVWGRKAT
jgi:SAM-dependent methyltransferase